MRHQANQEIDTKQPARRPAFRIRTFFEHLLALLPHHVPHKHAVHHVN
jgi:hypothetical protein